VGIIDGGRLVALDPPGALINKLTGVSSITTSAYLPLAELQSLPAITSVQRNGYQLHLQTSDVVLTLHTILELAARHQVSLHDLHIKQPNLEDVFLNLTGRTLRA
jgi:ABC-2 type transport system ATP-binding protein